MCSSHKRGESAVLAQRGQKVRTSKNEREQGEEKREKRMETGREIKKKSGQNATKTDSGHWDNYISLGHTSEKRSRAQETEGVTVKRVWTSGKG